MSCSIDKFRVSSVVIETAAVGVKRFVSSWNFHPVASDYDIFKFIYHTLLIKVQLNQ